MGKIIDFIKDKGIRGTWDTVKFHYHSDIKYNYWFKKHRVTEKELLKQKNVKFKYEPKISIIVPAFYTEITMIEELIDSVKNQSYSNWELCISIGSPEDRKLIEILSQYSNCDKIKYIISERNLGISDNTNCALKLASGDYIALLDHDDVIEPNALYEIANAVQDKTIDMIYTDEDKVNYKLTRYVSPYFKPDFSIDLLRSQNYITHLLVIKNELLQKAGSLLPEMDGAQDYDLILRCAEYANKIKHIPKVLYHWRIIEGSTAGNAESKMYCYEAGKRALENHLDRCNIEAEVCYAKLLGRYHIKYKLLGKPLLSVVVANATLKDKRRIKEAIVSTDGNTNIEFIFVSDDDLYKAYNNGARQTKGKIILFVLGACFPIEKNSIYELLSLSMQEKVGIVAPKILYRNNKIKHAGMILGFKNKVGYAFRGCDRRATTYMNRAEQNGNYSVVSPEVFIISKEVFDNVGGYDIKNDCELTQVLFCDKIIKKGLRIVYNAFSEWRSENIETEKNKSRVCDWSNINKKDPYYNENLSLHKRLFELE